MDKNNKLFRTALAETYKYASLLNIKEHAKMSYNDVARAIRESSQFRGIRSVEIQELAESVTRHLKESVMAEIDLEVEEAFADGLTAMEVATRLASVYGIKLTDAEQLVAQWQHANSGRVAEAEVQNPKALSKEKLKKQLEKVDMQIKNAQNRLEIAHERRRIAAQKGKGTGRLQSPAEQRIRSKMEELLQLRAALNAQLKELTGASVTEATSALQQRKSKDNAKHTALLPQVGQESEVNESFSGAIAEESKIKPGDHIRTIKMGQTPGVVEKVENGWVLFRHESGKLYRAPLSNVRLDESLSGRSSFDRAHQRFKHNELSHELRHEDEWYRRAQAQQTGSWYIKVDGRVWRKNGRPVEFNGRNHANAVALKMQTKLPGRVVTISAEPQDTPKHKLFREDEMTSGEKKERERIVKGMKRNKADFKGRYGDRGQGVMYATATKMATEGSESQADIVINKLAYSKVHPNNIGRFKQEARDYLLNNKSSPASTLMAGLQALAHFFARRSVNENVSFSKAITEGYQDELAAAQKILKAGNREYARSKDRSVLDRAQREYSKVYDRIVQQYPGDHSAQAAKNQVWGPEGTNESADSVIDSPEYNRLIDRVPHRIKQQHGIDAVAQAVEAAVRRSGARAQVSDVISQLADRSESEEWHNDQRSRQMYKSMGWM